jgi:hypothetical protein
MLPLLQMVAVVLLMGCWQLGGLTSLAADHAGPGGADGHGLGAEHGGLHLSGLCYPLK